MALAMEAAERLGVETVVFNQRHSAHCALCLAPTATGIDGSLMAGRVIHSLGAFSGVYARLSEVAALPENRPRGRMPADDRAVARAEFLNGALSDWLDLTPIRVVNRPQAMASNASKPFQARVIQRAGFLTPPTLVTNNPASVKDFQRLHGRIIYKSISSVRSIVRELLPADLGTLERIRNLPTQFQAYIDGVNVRVHVVDREVHATEVKSDAVDYRYATADGVAMQMQPTTLPDPVGRRCVGLSVQLGLAMTGIDLKRTPDGDWYCFEVNPSPGYSYYQQDTGQPIADSVVRFIAGIEPCQR